MNNVGIICYVFTTILIQNSPYIKQSVKMQFNYSLMNYICTSICNFAIFQLPKEEEEEE